MLGQRTHVLLDQLETRFGLIEGSADDLNPALQLVHASCKQSTAIRTAVGRFGIHCHARTSSNSVVNARLAGSPSPLDVEKLAQPALLLLGVSVGCVLSVMIVRAIVVDRVVVGSLDELV